jgi:hypothetical protein
MSALGRILLKKSKVATVRIFGEKLKRIRIVDSYSRSGAAEVAYEFSVRQRGPPGPAKTASKGRRIFDLLCRTTFSTVSGATQTSHEVSKVPILLQKSVEACGES